MPIWFRRPLPALVRALLCVCVLATPALAWESLTFTVSGSDKALKDELRNASLLRKLTPADRDQPRDVLAAALADYSALLNILYAHGHYGGVIHLRLDGREAANLSVITPPATIRRAEVEIDPGPPYRFARASVTPLAPGTILPPGFAKGRVAQSAVIRQALDAAATGWRNAGHARPELLDQSLSADHRARTLSVVLRMTPGPRVRFGDLNITSPSAVRAARIRKIAGLPTGEQFSPQTLTTVAKRLRRTGAFASVALSEGEIVPGAGSIDIDLALADEKPRRFGFGGEVSSLDGLALSGFWLHRNLMGGAERLRVDAAIRNIDRSAPGTDYSLGARLDIPAAFGPDTGAFAFGEVERVDDPGYRADQGALGIGLTRIFSDTLEGEVGVTLRRSRTRDDLGRRDFALLSLPAALTWDRRDDPLDATSGFYLSAQAEPFYGGRDGGSGLWAKADGRIYRQLGGSDRLVLAGRAQLGFVTGPRAVRTHPDHLFFSGGGTTVRGQPYQSLAVDLGGGNSIGGKTFAGLSGELRLRASRKFGVVAFIDMGHIGAERFFDSAGDWHSGGGLGLRYLTPLGPIRLDAAVPLHGGTGRGVQVYLGIGQVF